MRTFLLSKGRVWGLFLAGCFFQVCFLGLGIALGKADIGINTRYLFAVSPLSHLLRWVFYFSAIHVMLVWPLTQFVARSLSEVRSATARRLIYACLTVLPLSSFGYYLGTFRSVLDGVELLCTVLPAVLVGVHLYEESSRGVFFSLFVSIVTYFGFFLVGDLLGPFTTLLRYAPHDQSFILFQIAGPLMSIVLLSLFAQQTRRTLFEESHVLCLLFFLALGVGLLVNSRQDAIGGKHFYWAALFPFIFLLLRMRTTLAHRAVQTLTVLSLFCILMDTVFFLSRSDLGLGAALWVVLALSSSVTLFSLSLKLANAKLKIFFLEPDTKLTP